MQRQFGRFVRKGLRSTETLFKYRQIARYRAMLHRFAAFLKVYLHIHQSLIGVTIFILFTNALVVQAANTVPTYEGSQIISDPYEIADAVRVIGPYTFDIPGISEDPEIIAAALEEKVTGSFISTNPLLATAPGQTDEPAVVPAATTTAPSTAVAQERTADTKYTVEIGDTLSGIGSKFGLRVATLRVKNNLSNADDIKPGQELTVPPQDLSDKAIKAAEDRRKASVAYAAQSAPGKTISSSGGGYGLITPIRHKGISRGLVGGHTGIDYMADMGTPVIAADSGVVITAEGGWNGGYGNNVLLNNGSGLTTRYAHLKSYTVSSGEAVERGEIIGYSGNSGRSTGPHLHFELRVNGVARNPFP